MPTEEPLWNLDRTIRDQSERAQIRGGVHRRLPDNASLGLELDAPLRVCRRGCRARKSDTQYQYSKMR